MPTPPRLASAPVPGMDGTTPDPADHPSDLTELPAVRDQRGGRSEDPPRRVGPLARTILWIIGVYQRTASFRQPRCRFAPSCSEYARGAVRRHGVLRGLGYALRRLLRCHPWNPGGVDPVPPLHREKAH